MWAMPRALSAGGLLAPWAQPPAEKAHLTSRSLAFSVHPIGARPATGDAVQAFAYRYGSGWRVLYVGRRVAHKIGTAIGYGATHLLVREDGTADEAWLIDELEPPLNDGWR
ncbi:MAG: hypothetical protein JSS04_01025 [Proteobacteria bacterium]|nr:hypothetical protein [Pseudomonadota bacterium]